MSTLERFDETRDALCMGILNMTMEQAELQSIAVQSAFSEHPVARYVKDLPVQSPLFPANGYLRLAEQVGAPGDGWEQVPNGRGFIQWSMPAHDRDRPSRKGCGFVRSGSRGVVFTACPDDHEHVCRGKRMHCWSLHCPGCMNDTALRKAVTVERRLLSYRHLLIKQGSDPGQIGHWVVSPPQEFAKSMVQTLESFDDLNRHIEGSMQECGASAGVTVFHPWRQKSEEWAFSPHFHILCYGRIDTDRFRKENEGWVIKKVHPRERIRSIRHTVAYLMTHMGLGTVAKEPEDIDWDLDILDMLIPGIKSPGATYSDRDVQDMFAGTGRMVGDLSRIDWTKWTMDRLSTEVRMRSWGGASQASMRVVGVRRTYRLRACPDCGCLLRTYDGPFDIDGALVRYIQDSPVMVFARHYSIVLNVFERFRERLDSEGLDIVDFSRLTPYAVSSLDLGLEPNDDPIMDGPFDRPDDYYIGRQNRAYGQRMPSRGVTV